MDDDTEEGDDEILLSDDSEPIDCGPFPDQCPNEVIGIDSCRKCFVNRFEDCPAFFVGSLQSACEKSFHAIPIQDRRPILIYLHNDRNVFSNIFCKTIFCHSTVIDYLLDNYLVWPWDLTKISNRNTLENIWEKFFNRNLFEEFAIKDCIALIGISRLFEYNVDEVITTEYQYKLLLRDDMLIRTQTIVNLETLLNELCFFKDLWNKNELDISFNFHERSGLPWEIILQIAEYLSLNDMISTFSTDILPLLNHPQLRFQLSNPFSPLTRMIFQYLKTEQIVSLQLDTVQEWLQTDLSIFQNINSLTLLNLPCQKKITCFQEYYPNLICLSLYYDDEINFNMFNNIFDQLSSQIKRFEIHCAGVLCTHESTNQLNNWYTKRLNIEYFLFDIGHFPLVTSNECFRYYRSCFLVSIIDFIKNMQLIRHVDLIVNKYSIEQLLDTYSWKSLLNHCSDLKKVTLQVLGNTFENGRFLQEAMNIQVRLNSQRKAMKFRVKFL